MLIWLFTLLALLTATLHIAAEYKGVRTLVYFCKPLTTTLILGVALLVDAPVTRFYQAAIVVGLLFSLAGDIFLMLPQDRFVAGLVSFLCAHLCYSAAFFSQITLPLALGWALPLLLYMLVIYGLLARHVGQLQVPVLVYMLVICSMAWFALTLWRQTGQVWAASAAVGALLFVVSDSVLALNRFRRRFATAPLVVLSAYYAAQWLIALSVDSDLWARLR